MLNQHEIKLKQSNLSNNDNINKIKDSNQDFEIEHNINQKRKTKIIILKILKIIIIVNNQYKDSNYN